MIERVPVLVLSRDETTLIKQTLLKYYYFEWGEEEGDSAIALGCGFFYNHSYQPNADYHRRYEEREIHFTAIRDLEEGEEVLINYNGFVDDLTDVGFAVIY